MSDEWDGVIAKLKVAKAVYPELFSDLSGVPQRERGERLRLLAYVGLQVIRMGRPGGASSAQEGPAGQGEQGSPSAGEMAAERKGKLLGSLKLGDSK